MDIRRLNPLKVNNKGHYSALWRLFAKGTERRRRWYRDYIRLRNWETVSERKGLVSDLADETAFEIPQEKGFRVFDPGEYGGEQLDDVIQMGREAYEREGYDPEQGDERRLSTGYFRDEELEIDSPLIEFGLRRDLIASISQYLERVPILANVQLMVARARPDRHGDGDPQPVKSELYHCDWADTKQVKIFVFCNDVDLEDGPLTLLSAEDSQRLRESVGYRYGGSKYRLTDEQVYGVVDRSDRKVMTGTKGTVCFADTSRCFHFGSRTRSEDGLRVAIMYQYVTPTSFLFPPGGYQCEAPYRHLDAPELDRLERLVLGAV